MAVSVVDSFACTVVDSIADATKTDMIDVLLVFLMFSIVKFTFNNEMNVYVRYSDYSTIIF